MKPLLYKSSEICTAIWKSKRAWTDSLHQTNSSGKLQKAEQLSPIPENVYSTKKMKCKFWYCVIKRWQVPPKQPLFLNWSWYFAILCLINYLYRMNWFSQSQVAAAFYKMWDDFASETSFRFHKLLSIRQLSIVVTCVSFDVPKLSSVTKGHVM